MGIKAAKISRSLEPYFLLYPPDFEAAVFGRLLPLSSLYIHCLYYLLYIIIYRLCEVTTLAFTSTPSRRETHTVYYPDNARFLHVTGGMPARGSELMTVKKENTWSSMRNVFAAHNEWIMYLTEYSKTQSRTNAPRVIPRFFPMPVGRLLVTLLVDIVPFEGYLHDTAGMVKGGTPYLVANSEYTAPCFLLR